MFLRLGTRTTKPARQKLLARGQHNPKPIALGSLWNHSEMLNHVTGHPTWD